MKLHRFALAAALLQFAYAAPDESTEELNEDDGPPEQVLQAARQGDVEFDPTPFEALIKKCDNWEFPEEDFSEQPSSDKVYLKVSKTKDGPFKENGLTKFATVFGIRIIGQEDVSDEKILHVANVLAKVMDADLDGKPDNTKILKDLEAFHPSLFVMVDAENILSLMNAQEPEQGLPIELKFCPFAFDFEEASKINPGGPRDDATCEKEGEEQNDRTVAFVLDHLVGRGFGSVLNDDQRQKLDTIYQESIQAGTFEPENTGCPAEASDCGKVMFASWGLSTLLGFDKCWCEHSQALKFCDKDALKEGEPELVTILESLFPDIDKLDDSEYAPKDKDILVN